MKHLALLGAVLALAASTTRAQTPAMLKVGDQAPDFSLQATDGQTYKLSEFRGKKAVVLAWFPKALTRGCTLECKSLAENGHLLKNYQMTYFMASVDPLEDNLKFAKATSVTLGEQVVSKKEADFPILSDPTKQTATAYGVLTDRGFANWWPFYIGKEGKILGIDKTVKPETSAEDMASKLKELGVPGM